MGAAVSRSHFTSIGGCWAPLIDRLGVAIAWGWQREPTAFYAGQGASIFELAVGDVEELVEEGFELL